MKNDELDIMFEELDLDVAEPPKGHRDRFKERLREQRNSKAKPGKLYTLWTPYIGVAALLILSLMLLTEFVGFSDPEKRELGSVSPEMKNTQSFYTAVLQQELQNLEGMKNSQTSRMIEDALVQMEALESDYESLTVDLVKSGNDQRVIYAMVANFQQRIDLLNTLLEKVQHINNQNPEAHENAYF